MADFDIINSFHDISSVWEWYKVGKSVELHWNIYGVK